MFSNINHRFLCVLLVLILNNCLFGQLSESLTNVRFNKISTQQGLSQSSVFALAQDKNGFIWIGTRDGLNRFDGYSFIKYKYNPQDTNSLSHNEITKIHVNSKGDLWIGTRGGGLNQYIYDKNEFRRYLELDYKNIVNDIFEDQKGNLWIGTPEGLFRGNYNKERNIYLFENVTQSSIYKTRDGEFVARQKSIISVASINQLSDDIIIIGTRGGVFNYSISKKQYTLMDMGVANYNYITSLIVEDDGIIWAGSYDGLVKAGPVNDSSFEYTFTNYSIDQQGKQRLLVNRIETLVKDPYGNMWVGTRGGGLINIKKDGEVITYLNEISDVNSLSENIINSLLVDNTGMLWIGTESKGCNTLDLYRKKFYHIKNLPNNKNSLGDNLVTAISGDKKNKVWVGTAVKGLDEIIFNKDHTYQINHYSNISLTSGFIIKEIISLFEDKNKALWIGTATNSIFRYKEPEGFRSYPVNGYVYSIYQDYTGKIWLGRWGQGLGWIKEKTGEVTNYTHIPRDNHSLSSDIVLAIYGDTMGNLWIGTKGGGVNVIPLNILSQGQGDFIYFKHDRNNPNSLSHNDVYCITQDSRGDIWIGTGGGLNKVAWGNKKPNTEFILKKEIDFISYIEEHGLPNNLIYGILEDDKGNLWLSTNEGISVFNPVNECFKNYSVNDGIQANEFHSNAYFKDNRGYMYFGGVNGLTFFHPDSIHDNPYQPEVVITGLKIFNKYIHPGEEINGRIILEKDISNTKNIVLSYKAKEITFEFSALYYTNPQSIRYAYRLLGFNEKWQEAGKNNRYATYTNLDEGDYIFQVKTINNEEIWKNLPTEIEITVLPPFWRKPWFYFIYAIIIIIFLLIFRRYSLIAVKEKNKLLIERLENKKHIEISEAKMRFFTNISHEIRTPLTLISDPLKKVLSEGEIDETSRKNLKLVSKNVTRLLELINQLIQLRKIDLGYIKLKVSEVDLVPFIMGIMEDFEEYAHKRDINFSFNSEAKSIHLYLDKELITVVFYNLLSNAFKYTPDGGSISLKIDKHQGRMSKRLYHNIRQRLLLKNNISQWVAVEVADSGTGIPEKELNNIFYRFYQAYNPELQLHTGSGIGLSLVKEYIELHKGYIDVKSKPNEGSIFTIYFPVGQAHFDTAQLIKQETPKILPQEKIQRDDISIEEKIDKHDEEFIDRKGIRKEKAPTILIIEDDIELSNYISQYLCNLYNIEQVENGKKGLEMARNLMPDLIISDLMLPEMDGYRVCENLKTNIETSHIPVIILTAKASEENILEGYEKGADSYIIKPFNIEILKTQIKKIIESRILLQEKYSKLITLKPRDITITSIDEKFLNKLLDIIEANINDTEFDVTKLVENMNMGHTTILRKVKALTNLSLVDFIKNHRLKKAAMILQKEKLPIAEVAYMVGFSDPKYFSKCFVKEFSKTPTKYCNEFRNEH
ncbi:MAG: response regulator [Bacteroidales bacterium]|nr:response regulator [Bacteroidales bacterium]